MTITYSARREALSTGVYGWADDMFAVLEPWGFDFAAICVHQVTVPYLRTLLDGSGIPAERVVLTLPEHGNLASASLAFGLSTAIEQARAGPGDRVALVRLAGGVSLGVLFAEL